MTTGTSGHGTTQKSRDHLNKLRVAQALKDWRRQRRIRSPWGGVMVAVIGIVLAMMLTSRQETSSVARVAPAFTLTSTSGAQIEPGGAARQGCLALLQ